MSILFLSPHSGINCPDELLGMHELSVFQIFMESSYGVDRLFSFNSDKFKIIKNEISHLFIDPEKSYEDIYPVRKDGVIKTMTSMGKNIYSSNYYPDDIAISNILKRYYFPFIRKTEKLLDQCNIDLIIICKTHMPVYPERSQKSGEPTPVVNIRKSPPSSHRDYGISYLAEELGKRLFKECDSVGEKFQIGNIENSYLHDHFIMKVPVIEITFIKSLFINDRDFNLNTLEVNDKRFTYLSGIIEDIFLKFYGNIYG